MKPFATRCAKRSQEFSRTGLKDQAVWELFASTLYYVRGGYDEADGYHSLKQFIDGFDRSSRVMPGRVFYLATPPDSLRSGDRARRRGWIDAQGSGRRGAHSRGHRKALRHGSANGAGAEPSGARGPGRKSGLSHRSLSRQRDRAKYHGLPFCQRDLRTDLEPPLCRSCPDHRGGERRRRKTAAATTKRPASCATCFRIT